jgi:pectinesterase
MKRYLFLIGLSLFFLLVTSPYAFARYADVVVAADGSGNFKTLTEAMTSLPMYNYQRYVIYVKNGVYHEKILIDRDYITISGESRDSTIIEFSQLRSDWQEKPDYIGAAVVNITADDVILENLTIRNTQPQIGPHAFTVYGTGTRTIIVNCKVTSNGGDTVSLWNYKNGMYYHAGCYFEGGVDFVCPRGWCYIRDSRFYENSSTAAIWHAAVTNKDQKMVLWNCTFDGVQDFYLARHHYEAQFYFLHCRFSSSMVDKPPFYFNYPDEPAKNRPYFYGDRYYFYDCHRTTGDYSWHTDNDVDWPNQEKPEDITAKWTFNGIWDPESTTAPKATGYAFKDHRLFIYFNELLCVRGNLVLETTTGKKLVFYQGQGRDILSFSCDQELQEKEITGEFKIISGSVIGNTATTCERYVSMSGLQ